MSCLWGVFIQLVFVVAGRFEVSIPNSVRNFSVHAIKPFLRDFEFLHLFLEEGVKILRFCMRMTFPSVIVLMHNVRTGAEGNMLCFEAHITPEKADK